MTFDEWWDGTEEIGTPDTYRGWEETCRKAWNAGAKAEREECAKLCDERAALENEKASDFKACGSNHLLWAMYSNNAGQNTLMASEIRKRPNDGVQGLGAALCDKSTGT